MVERQKIILIAGLVVLILGGLIIWGLTRPSQEDLLQETPGLPESEWPRLISVKEKDSEKIVTNKFDGYEIIVPSDWNVPERAGRGGGHEIVYQDLFLRIFTLDAIEKAEDFFPSSARFEDVETSAGRAYKTTFQPTEDKLDSEGNVIEAPVENSLVIGYVFSPDDKKTYVLTCLIIDGNLNELASLCEKQILTFKIIK